MISVDEWSQSTPFHEGVHPGLLSTDITTQQRYQQSPDQGRTECHFSKALNKTLGVEGELIKGKLDGHFR